MPTKEEKVRQLTDVIRPFIGEKLTAEVQEEIIEAIGALLEEWDEGDYEGEGDPVRI